MPKIGGLSSGLQTMPCPVAADSWGSGTGKQILINSDDEVLQKRLSNVLGSNFGKSFDRTGTCIHQF